MEIALLAAGTRLPAWMNDGYQQYASRLTREVQLTLHEIPVAARRGRDSRDWRVEEGASMLARIRPSDWLVALDVTGKPAATDVLSTWLERWLTAGRRVVMAIGGPDGLAPDVLARADQRWSLSPLTFPHGLARVVVAEALYRAYCVRAGHPYHRA